LNPSWTKRGQFDCATVFLSMVPNSGLFESVGHGFRNGIA